MNSMLKKVKKAVGGKSKSKKDVQEESEMEEEALEGEEAPDLVEDSSAPDATAKKDKSDAKMSESSKGDKSARGKTSRTTKQAETSWQRNSSGNTERGRTESASPSRSLTRSASPKRDLSPNRSGATSPASPTRTTPTRTRSTSPTRGGAGKKKTVTKVKKTVSKKSKWEEGVALIDELLLVDSATYNAMTPQQRKSLANLKNLLFVSQSTTAGGTATGNSPARINSMQHVPRDLIIEQKKEQKRRQRQIFPKNQPRGAPDRSAAMASLKRGSTYFILQEYAGVKGDDPLLSDEPLKPRRGKRPTNIAVSGRSTSTSSSTEPATGSTAPTKTSTPRPPQLQVRMSGGGQTQAALYVPQEFKDLPKENQKRLCELLSWESISGWGFDIFELDKLTKGQPLLFMGWAVLGAPYAQAAMKQGSWNVLGDGGSAGGYPFLDEFKIPPHKLCNYLRVIQEDYHDNPYHNKVHAGDVVQSLHCFIQMALKSKDSFLKNVPNIQLFAILLSAVVHDVDHPGKNNAFQMKLKTELAVVYNDHSVLENWHVACAFARMLDLSLLKANFHPSQVVHAKLNHEHKDAECNILGQVTTDEFDTIRNLMIEAVLHTDMSKHFAMVSAAKGAIMTITADAGNGSSGGAGDGNNALAWNALMFMLHMADISNQAKPGTLARIWTDRCMKEFFAQGDEEAKLEVPISPNCDRNITALPESQVGFIKFVVQPAYEALGDLIPGVKEKVLPMVQANLDHWQREKEIEEGSLAPDDGDLSDDDLMSIDSSGGH